MSREGSVRRDTSGRWGFVVDVTPVGSVQRKQVRRRGFRTKALALEALDEVKSQLRTGSWVPPSRQTVSEFLEEWLATVAPELRPATLYSYQRNVRLHVVERIGHVPLQSLDAGILNRLYADLLQPGSNRARPDRALAPRTVAYIATIMKSALTDAVRWGRLVRNPADAANPPKAAAHQRPDMLTWTPTELSRFLELSAENKDRDVALWRFLATTGARRGEALGLRWRDVDLDAGTATVRVTVIVVAHQIQFGSPKTNAGVHSIDLDGGTVAALREHRRRQAAERLLVGPGWVDHDLMFADPAGGPMHPEAVSMRFARRVRLYELPKLTVHGLRHTWATMALSAGVHPKVVQERLGHATIGITLGVYSHVTKGMGRAAGQLVADLIDSPVTIL